MQITDMLSQYNRNLANGVEISGGTQGIRQIASSLQQMPVGNVFEGSVNHMENGVVTLGLSDGKTIQARLDSGVTVRVGESMFFQVRSNNGAQIAIRPFSQAGGMNPALLNALKAASLPADGRMVTMVNSMMEQSMPIDKQSLAQMAKLVTANERMDAATVVQMTKLGIPVTEEMAAQFENYKSDQYAILDQLESVMETIPEQLANGGENLKELLEFNRQMIHVLIGEAQATADGKVTVSEGTHQTKAAEIILQPGKEASGSQSVLLQEGENVQSGAQAAEGTGAWQEAGAAGEAAMQQGTGATGETGVQQGATGETVMQQGATGETVMQQGVTGGIGIQQEAGAAGEAVMQQGAEDLGEMGSKQGNEAAGKLETQKAAQAVSEEGIFSSGNTKNTVQLQHDALKNVFSSADLQQLSARLAKIPELSQNPAVFADGTLASDLTSKELLHLIGQAFSSRNPFSRQALSDLASSKEYRTLIRSVMEQQWLLRPEELKGEHKVSELYQRLDRQMEQMEKVLKAFGQNTPQLSDTASNVRSNIQFMNQLNQTWAYVQIPLKLAGQNAHSDLYVYTDKRKKREKGDELTAFLHLDLDNLGSTDVSVKLRNKQVATDFYLADDVSYRLIAEHIEILEKRLLEKGYQAQIHIKNQGEKVNFVEDMLSRGTPSAGGMVHRYSFDVRA